MMDFSETYKSLRTSTRVISDIYYILEYNNSEESKQNFLLDKGVEIDIQNLSVNYGKINVLNNINLSISTGDIIALVGKSGSGKSTLLDSISQLNSYKGKCFYNGMDSNKINIKSIWNCVSYLSQNEIIKGLNIYESVSMQSKYDKARIELLIGELGISESIEKLPSGYETIIGEEGNSLSTGELQRLNIARALYKDSQIILLDEPSSALDIYTERKIFDLLSKQKEKLIIIASHSDIIFGYISRVLLLENGIIFEHEKFK